jgi:predicted transcriptional regulator
MTTKEIAKNLNEKEKWVKKQILSLLKNKIIVKKTNP